MKAAAAVKPAPAPRRSPAKSSDRDATGKAAPGRAQMPLYLRDRLTESQDGRRDGSARGPADRHTDVPASRAQPSVDRATVVGAEPVLNHRVRARRTETPGDRAPDQRPGATARPETGPRRDASGRMPTGAPEQAAPTEKPAEKPTAKAVQDSDERSAEESTERGPSAASPVLGANLPESMAASSLAPQPSSASAPAVGADSGAATAAASPSPAEAPAAAIGPDREQARTTPPGSGAGVAPSESGEAGATAADGQADAGRLNASAAPSAEAKPSAPTDGEAEGAKPAAEPSAQGAGEAAQAQGEAQPKEAIEDAAAEGGEGAAAAGTAAGQATAEGGAAPTAEQGGEAEGGGESEGEAEMEERLAAVGGASGPDEEAEAAPETEPESAPESEAESQRAAQELVPETQDPTSGAGAGAGAGPASDGPPSALLNAERDADDAVNEQRAAEDAEEQIERTPPSGLGGGAPALAETDVEPDTGGGLDDEAEGAADGDNAPLSPAERDVAMSSLSESAGGGGGGLGGGGGGGGAIEDSPEPSPPDLSGSDPEAAMGTLASLEPAAAVQALGGVAASVGTAVGGERESLASNPPEVPRPYGLNPARGSASEAARQAPVAEDAGAVTPTPEGAAVPVPEPEPLPTPPPPPTQGLAEPKVQGGEGGELSDADVERMKGSIGSLPVTDEALRQTPGEAPKLDMQGDADPAQMQDQRAELDATMTEARAQGAKDAAQPMGEDAILPKRQGPAERLKATIPAGGGAAAGGGPGEVPPEAAGIIAKERSGAELATAAQKAQTDMAAKRGEHRTRVANEKAKSDAEIAALEATAAADQSTEQRNAQSKVAGMRGEWSAAQAAAVEKRGGEAQTAMAEGDQRVSDQQTQGEAEATGHIETGVTEVADAREQGESEAQAQKAKAEEQSSGFFGWLASKAKAFFDGIKKGIQKAFEKARAAVKAAIDKAKKLALAAIEKARSAIVAAIKKVGAALIAIGDKLLADFPGLRDRFRKAIEGAVTAAEAAVNRIADGLKAGVQKALDLLGGALDAALGLLEKGLLAVVDTYSAAVQGALKAAQAVADALGMFAVLVKDIAAGPGQWIANLASGIMDGLKNHLWPAFKTAVQGWFSQKVEEVLGLGTALWGILSKGGIALAEVGKMAWEALKSAIPPTLIQLLVEKLMSMIVPAAGAVMAVIEGLQAAWGSVQRVIAAVGAFMSFLKSVKPGAAGPPFAKALAAGAVVVIDFVANWLLRRLRKPAGKVAGKLKAIGKKILAKLKKAAKKVGRKLKAAAKKIGRKLKAAGRKIQRKFSRKKKRRKGKEKPKKTKAEKKQERLDKAARELPPKINALVSKGVGKMAMRARLLYWRARYRLSGLEIRGAGSGVSIRATVNPSIDLVSRLLIEEGPKLFKMIREIGRKMLARPDVQQAMERIVEQRAKGKGKTKDDPIETEPGGAGGLGQAADVAKFPSGKAAKDPSSLPAGTARPRGTMEHIQSPGGVTAENQSYSSGPGHVKTIFEGHRGSYGEIRAELDAFKSMTGKSDADVARALIVAQQTGKIPSEFEGLTNLKSMLRLDKVEMGRSSAHVVTGTLAREMAAEGNMTTEELFGPEGNTMERKKAVPISSQAAADVTGRPEREYANKRSASKAEVQRMLNTELELMSRYIFSKLNVDKPLVRDAGQLETLIKKELQDYVEDMVEKGLFGGIGIL